MYTFRLLTHFGAWSGLRSFKFHRLATVINHVCRRLHQGQHFSVLDTQNVLHSKDTWSRRYTSQISSKYKVVLDRVENLNVPQVESADYKRNVLDFVSFYYDHENQTGQNAVDTSMSIMDLYQIHIIRRFNGFIPQIKEHLTKSDSFKKLLETLPDHVENISITDQIDIYMGLELLGVSDTNLTMSRLFCNFYKEDSIGMLELAKINAIFSCKSISAFHKKSIIMPKFRYLLKNNSIRNHEDCKSLALMLQNGYHLYDFSSYIVACNQMFEYADQLNDIDLTLKILRAVFSCGIHFKFFDALQEHQYLFSTLEKFLYRLQPQIETLTSSQIVDFLSEFQTSSVKWINLNYLKIWQCVCKRANICIKEILSGDLMLEEKVNYLYLMSVITVRATGFFPEQEEIMDLMNKTIPGANLKTIYQLCILTYTLNKVDREPEAPMNQYTLNLAKKLLYIINSQPTYFFEMDGVKMLECFKSLLHNRLSFNEALLNFDTYLLWLLESGHACPRQNFFNICRYSIPILGYKMPIVVKDKIKRHISESYGGSDWNYIIDVLKGIESTTIFSKRNFKNFEDILRLITIKLQHERLDAITVFLLVHKINFLMYNNLSIELFRKAVAGQIIIEFPLWEQSLKKRVASYISETNANKLLEIVFSRHISGNPVRGDSVEVFSVLIHMFYEMSRYPKKKHLLEKFSRYVYDNNFDTSHNFMFMIVYLHVLCCLGIYLDPYIQKVFSKNYLKKLDAQLAKELPHIQMAFMSRFAGLNKEVVLHRQELNIPWICGDTLNDVTPYFTLKLHPTVSFYNVELHLNILLGYSFVMPNVRAQYGIYVDFELYLDSTNEPVVYEMAKKMENSKSDIQKIAVNISRRTRKEYLAVDPEEISVFNANMIKDLNAVGYRAVLIQGHEWHPLSFEERQDFLKEKIFKRT